MISTLPPLTLRTAADIYNDIITSLESSAGEPLYPGDERRIYGEALVAVYVALRNTLDDTARQIMLRYARGQVLDELGARLDVTRLPGDRATTIMRFSVAQPRPVNIIIPAGTKVTPDSEHYFVTDDIAVLQAGSTFVDVHTSAVAIGADYNGFAPDTVTTLVDLIPFISGVTNVTPTAGGDDGEPYTSGGDDRLRERIRLAPSKRSTAGPEQAYVYWAMEADSSIVDAKAVSETETITRTLTVYDSHAFLGGSTLLPGTLAVRASPDADPELHGSGYTALYADDLLTITLTGALAQASVITVNIDRTMEGRVKAIPLLSGGRIPDEAVLTKVADAVNADDIQPLTDMVSVVAPDAVPYDIELVYYTNPGDEANVVAAIEGSGGAIDQYILWQSSALGRDINPDQLRRHILSPAWSDGLMGAHRVTVIKPDFLSLDDTQFAQFSGNLTVSHELENEVV